MLLLLNYKEMCFLAQSSKLSELFIAPLGIFLSYKFNVTYFYLKYFNQVKHGVCVACLVAVKFARQQIRTVVFK